MTSFDGGSPDDAGLLPPEESLDEEELGLDPDEGYSPAERPVGISAWGTTAREESTGEDLRHRLAREEPDLDATDLGDGIGDTADTDGEVIDDQVGDSRSGRLVLSDIDPADPVTDFWARDVGIDGAGASAEEAAVHIVRDDDDDR